MTQKDLIVNRLRKGWCSPLDALYVAGTMKLSSRVGELRRAGYVILDQWSKDRRFKIYRLVK